MPELRPYQPPAIRFLTNRYPKLPGSGFWLGCGLGKTAVVLHAIDEIRDWRKIKRTVVVAPAKVIATSWPKEISKWGLDLSYDILNTHTWDDAIRSSCDILFVSAEDLALRQLAEDVKSKRRNPQLAERIELSKFDLRADLLVVDEITKFKNWTAARTKVLRKLAAKVRHRVTLTGSPTPNCLGEVFSQHYILDRGQTLTPYIGHFRDKYMRNCGFENRGWEMRPEMVQPLLDTLRPWYMCQEAIDHLDMPELIENIVDVQLPPAAMAKYKKMEKEMYAELDGGDTVTALSGGSRYNYCRQMASGCTYTDDDGSAIVHKAKVEKLKDIIEELQGKPLLVAYWYHHEGDLLASEIPGAVVVNGSTSSSKLVSIIAKWQKGEIPVMIAQASSISHGIDGLQQGCNNLCWFTLSDNPDVVHQLTCRVYRQGNDGNSVVMHFLMAEGTIDRKVLRAYKAKAKNQSEVLAYIKSAVDGTPDSRYIGST